ncbi:MAG: hypothetical protein J5441_05770 [Clostridia bacterium]|nr:hypothetical protein [Clostridia bacterium]
MKNNTGRFISIVVSVLLIAYVAYNIFNLVYDPVKTERALRVRVDDSITVAGVALRSERLVDTSASGIVDYLVSDGARVAKGERIARIYASASGADVEKQLRETEAEIARLEAALGAQGTGVDAYSIETNIRGGFAKLADACREGRLKNVGAVMDEVLTDFNMRQVVQGNVEGFTARLEELKAERDRLQETRAGDYDTVTSPDSGYFVSYTDSFENVADYDSITELTPKEIARICERTPEVSEDSGTGKLIDQYEWFYVAPISEADAARLEVGRTLPVRFSSSLAYDVYFTVEKLEADEEGNRAVIFSCNNVNSELACMRVDRATVKLNSFSGVRVNSDALRVVDGEQGVYIARGQKVAFRKVDLVYTGDGYVISRIRRDDPSMLQLYDDVIIGGRNMYAGKLI